MYRAIESRYTGGASTISLGCKLGYTDFFPIETGVRQGCILSPWLYALFINDLAKTIKKETGTGVQVQTGEDSWSELHLLMYADDIALLAHSPLALQRQLNIVASYSHQWRFEVNHGKSGLMSFHPRTNTHPDPPLQLAGKAIPWPWVSSYKYLGVDIGVGGRPFSAYRRRALTRTHRAAIHLIFFTMPVYMHSVIRRQRVKCQ